MRQRGLAIAVASINPPDRAHDKLSAVEAQEADQTFYVKSGGIASVAFLVIKIAAAHPSAFLRGLKSAAKLGGWDLKSRAFAIFYLAEALLVGDWMRRHALQHLHVHFGGPVATVGMLTSAAWKVPWSVTLHGPDEFFDQQAFYLPQKIASARFIVCISDFCRSQVLRIVSDLEEGRLQTIRLGVDCEALQPSNPQHLLEGQQGPSFRLVCTGRMVTAKGHRVLIGAIKALVAEKIDLTCTLIGDGPERSALQSLCAQCGIQDRVRFLGALAHQATLEEVAKADVFVLASFAEGLPVALMEAMALGVPCVSTTIAAIPELIRDGVSGMLVAPANSVALGQALLRLARDPGLRQQLGHNARKTVEEQYNLAVNLNKLGQMWSERLKSPE